ncbi:MAG: 50S ribosomal protein L37Ae [Candidatus Hydrothermarchaeota archaeon]
MTKKVGPTGRFGPRYGRRLRKLVADIERKSKVKHKCVKCGETVLKRTGTGIWKCKKCGSVMAGGAYTPTTPGGDEVERVIKRMEGE